MKATLTFAVLECVLFTSVLQQFGLAAPTYTTLPVGDGIAAISSSSVKRDANYRNQVFSSYLCSIEKAKNLVWSKLQVSVM